MAFSDWLRYRAEVRPLRKEGFVTTRFHRYVVPAAVAEADMPSEGDYLPGESGLTGERVASVSLVPPPRGRHSPEVHVTGYRLTGTATHITGSVDNLILLLRGPVERDGFNRNTRAVVYAAPVGTSPGFYELGAAVGDYVVTDIETTDRHWAGHHLLSATMVDTRPSVSDDGRVGYETHVVVVANGGTLPVPGDKYTGDSDLTGRYVQKVDYSRPISGGKTLCGVVYYQLRGDSDGTYLTLSGATVSGESTDQRVYDVTVACLPAAANPTYGTQFSGDTDVTIHRAALLSFSRQSLQWPAHDAIQSRYVGSRSNGLVGELKSSYRRERLGLKAWRSERRLEILPANLGTVEAALYDTVDPYLQNEGDYSPRCFHTQAVSEARPGVMLVTARYETPRNEGYARITVRGSKRTEPLIRDLNDDICQGPIDEEGQTGFWRIVSGYTTLPKGVAVIMVHTAFRNVVDLQDLVLDKMWHVNSNDMTSLGSAFTAGTMLLLGPEMTRAWRRGALWYADYAFLYEPAGHNSLTKRQKFCEPVMLEPQYIFGAGNVRDTFDEDPETWSAVTREIPGYIEQTPGGGGLASVVPSEPESTVVFDSADFGTLNGWITWDE